MRMGFPASHACSKGMCLSGFDNVRRVSSNAFEIAIVLSTFPGVIRPYVHAETSKKKYCAKERPMSRCFIWTAAASNLLWVRLKSDVCVSWITKHLCGLLDMMHSLHQSGWERRSSRDHISLVYAAKMHRKPWFLPSNTEVFCKYCLNQFWERLSCHFNIEANILNPWLKEWKTPSGILNIRWFDDVETGLIQKRVYHHVPSSNGQQIEPHHFQTHPNLLFLGEIRIFGGSTHLFLLHKSPLNPGSGQNKACCAVAACLSTPSPFGSATWPQWGSWWLPRFLRGM